MNADNEYIGDGVYVGIARCGSLVLTTGTHVEQDADNVIYLEPQVLFNLLQYVERTRQKYKTKTDIKNDNKGTV